MTVILLIITFKGSSPCSQKLASQSTVEQQPPSNFSPRYYPPTSFYRTRWRIFFVMPVIFSLLKFTWRGLDVAATAVNAMIFNLFLCHGPFWGSGETYEPLLRKMYLYA